MKINWKVRWNNVLFVCQILVSIILPICAYTGVNWNSITSWTMLGHTLLQAIGNPVIVVGIVISVFNAITDPTTKGLSDSLRALGYTVPNDDRAPEDNEEAMG